MVFAARLLRGMGLLALCLLVGLGMILVAAGFDWAWRLGYERLVLGAIIAALLAASYALGDVRL